MSSTEQALPTTAQRAVFLAYTNDDRDLANLITNALRERGIDVIRIEDVIQPGDSITTVLSQAINRADVVVILLSQQATKSQWIQWETLLAVAKAISGRGRVLPVLTSKGVDVPFMLRDLTYFDLTRVHDLTPLITSIEKALSESAITAVDSQAPKGTDQTTPSQRITFQGSTSFRDFIQGDASILDLTTSEVDNVLEANQLAWEHLETKYSQVRSRYLTSLVLVSTISFLVTALVLSYISSSHILQPLLAILTGLAGGFLGFYFSRIRR